MSQSYLPENLPSFLRHEKLLKALVAMRTPAALALLGSLGIHGMVFVGLPAITHKPPDEAEEKEVVKTIELTPAEQGRLPKISTPIVTLPNTVPPTGKTLPPSPSASSFPTTGVPYTPSTSSYPSWYEGYNQPQTQARNTYPADPATDKKTQKQKTESEHEGGSGDPTVNPNSEASPSPSPPPAATPADNTSGRARDLQGGSRKGVDEDTYDSKGTGESDNNKQLQDWFGTLPRGTKIATANHLEISKEFPDKYPKSLCEDKKFMQGDREVIASFVVRIDANGKPEEPQFTRSTGYKRLNQYALKLVKESPTLKDGRFQAYTFGVSFEYDPEKCATGLQ